MEWSWVRVPPFGTPLSMEDQSMAEVETLDIPWFLIGRYCDKCGAKYYPKVKAQRYCDDHRHLSGAPIRAMTSNSGEVKHE